MSLLFFCFLAYFTILFILVNCSHHFSIHYKLCHKNSMERYVLSFTSFINCRRSRPVFWLKFWWGLLFLIDFSRKLPIFSRFLDKLNIFPIIKVLIIFSLNFIKKFVKNFFVTTDLRRHVQQVCQRRENKLEELLGMGPKLLSLLCCYVCYS